MRVQGLPEVRRCLKVTWQIDEGSKFDLGSLTPGSMLVPPDNDKATRGAWRAQTLESDRPGRESWSPPILVNDLGGVA